ncbi:hypothetical protein F4604DRAFT_1685478 [Suillus subluteus]|nr:hypothetical protein F4604DRAFT_1685478 [Suillus subluteus]
MSENGETSETIASELISQYQLGQNGKAYTILTIREILIDSPAVRSGRNLNDALDIYIGMLNEIDILKRGAADQGQQQNEGLQQEEEIERENRGPTDVEETKDGSKRGRDDSESEEEDLPSSKQAKVVNTSKFPWAQRHTEALASLPLDIRETYKQLDNFTADPKSVITNILSTPGCPPFPPGEWLNIVRWKYVNLGKFLDSAHTTELDPKQTHIIDDEIELALQVSKSSGGIKMSSDHNITFSMYIEAITFVFPQRRDKFTQYHTYLSRLFHAMET